VYVRGGVVGNVSVRGEFVRTAGRVGPGRARLGVPGRPRPGHRPRAHRHQQPQRHADQHSHHGESARGALNGQREGPDQRSHRIAEPHRKHPHPLHPGQLTLVRKPRRQRTNRRHEDRIDRAEDQGQGVQQPQLRVVGPGQSGGAEHHPAPYEVAADQDAAWAEAVGEHAAAEHEDGTGYRSGGEDGTDLGGTGGAGGGPGQGHEVGDIAGDRRRVGAQPAQDVGITEGGPRGHVSSSSNGNICSRTATRSAPSVRSRTR
jgi:hypothetical protein